MSSDYRGITFACLIGIAAGSAASAQNSPTAIAVTTINADSKSVVGAVEINVDGRNATTDTSGQVVISGLVPGRHHVQARHLGFQPVSAYVECTEGETLRVRLMMRQSGPMLDTQHVVARGASVGLREFEERRALGEGRFLTREEIDKFAGRELATQLAVRLPETRVQVGRTGGRYLMSLRTLGGAAGCVSRVFLDGLRHDPDLTTIRPESLAGVEFYQGTNIPAEFRAGAPCGVLVLWSRP
jgi:hypothetical protein